MSEELSYIKQHIIRTRKRQRKRLLRRLLYFMYRYGDKDVSYYKEAADGTLKLESNYIRRFVEDELGELLTKEFCGVDIFYPLKSLYSYSCTTQIQKTIFFAEQSIINEIKIRYIEKDNVKINGLISQYGVSNYLFALLHLIQTSGLLLPDENGMFKELEETLYIEYLHCFFGLIYGTPKPNETSILIELINRVLE